MAWSSRPRPRFDRIDRLGTCFRRMCSIMWFWWVSHVSQKYMNQRLFVPERSISVTTIDSIRLSKSLIRKQAIVVRSPWQRSEFERRYQGTSTLRNGMQTEGDSFFVNWPYKLLSPRVMRGKVHIGSYGCPNRNSKCRGLSKLVIVFVYKLSSDKNWWGAIFQW